MTTTRTVRSYGADSIYLEGLTSGPGAGWTWDGSALSHPLGITIKLSGAAAARVEAVVTAYVPAAAERLSGLQVSRLPEAERAQFEYETNEQASQRADEHIGHYVRRTPPVAGICTFDVTEATVIKH
jgi:hypothetical protein